VAHLAACTGHRFVRINNHEQTDLQEYLGSYVADEQVGLRRGARPAPYPNPKRSSTSPTSRRSRAAALALRAQPAMPRRSMLGIALVCTGQAEAGCCHGGGRRRAEHN